MRVISSSLSLIKLADPLVKRSIYTEQVQVTANSTLPPIESKLMPSTGNVKVLVVHLSFTDEPRTISWHQLNNITNGDGSESQYGYPIESVNRFYSRSSYGQLNISANIRTYNAPYSRSQIQTWSDRQYVVRLALQHISNSGENFAI